MLSRLQGKHTGKHSHKAQSDNKRAALGWHKLPEELKLKIVESAMILPIAVEFCPEPFKYQPGSGHKLTTAMKLAFQRAEAHQKYLIRKHLIPFLGLLRVSKVYGKEAAKALYGKNEFRFSNTAGWLGLDHFLLSIGKHNARLIQNITIIHPNWALLPGSLANAYAYESGMMHLAARFVPIRWFDNPDRFLTRPMRKLESFGSLRKLRVLYTSDMDDSDLELVGDFLNRSKFKNLEITISRKSRGYAPSRDFSSFQQLPSVLGCTVGEIAEQHNIYSGTSWPYEELLINRLGCYTVLQVGDSEQAEL